MNTKLLESLAEMILSLSEEEREFLDTKIKTFKSSTASQLIQSEVLDLENRLKIFENQYNMSSDDFYQRFRAGELGDGIDFFEWSVFYEMRKTARNQSTSSDYNHT
ncbi:MAG TPA: hypothetical protein V6D28_20050 [Leptolyngbyaceae cyanobacterium]